MIREKLQGLADYFKLLFEAERFSDKLVVLLYILKSPSHIFNKNHSFNFARRIHIKNKYGRFVTNKDIFSAISVSSFFEKRTAPFAKLGDGAFVDVGSNIGAYAIRVARQYPQNKVIAIEMVKQNIDTLRENIELNNLKNVIVVNKGCFSNKGKMKFYRDTVGSGGHSLVDKISNERVEIEVDKLDNILRELKVSKVDLIKTDAEGAEPEVLKGALRTVKKYRPVIIYEAHKAETRQECEEFFNSLEYSTELIHGSGFVAKPAKKS